MEVVNFEYINLLRKEGVLKWNIGMIIKNCIILKMMSIISMWMNNWKK
jgi:hypothetical protein